MKLLRLLRQILFYFMDDFQLHMLSMSGRKTQLSNKKWVQKAAQKGQPWPQPVAHRWLDALVFLDEERWSSATSPGGAARLRGAARRPCTVESHRSGGVVSLQPAWESPKNWLL